MGRRKEDRGRGKKRELQSGQEKGNDFMVNVCLAMSIRDLDLKDETLQNLRIIDTDRKQKGEDR